jgi:hypothetical protein
MFFCEIEIKGGIRCGRKIQVLWRYLYKPFLKFCIFFYIHPNQNSENVFPFIIWFYGSAIVIIRGWGCGFGNRREDIVAWSDNREGTFFYSPRIYGGSCALSGYLTP